MEKEERPVIIAWLNDPSRVMHQYASDAIFEQLYDEVFDPNPARSHVITLHLYVEHWLDRLFKKLGTKRPWSFSKKLDALFVKGVFEPQLYENLKVINQLRNIYAHQLDLAKAHKKVVRALESIQLDPYFMTTDPDKLRAVCVQTMFLLEATYNNECKPPKLPAFPTEAAKQRLIADGRLFWQECEILKKKQPGEHLLTWILRCPLCKTGLIKREKDNTPGFRESNFHPCDSCGLDGDGSYLSLQTAKKR